MDRIQSEKPSLDLTNHGGDIRLAKARKGRVKVVVNMNYHIYSSYNIYGGGGN